MDQFKKAQEIAQQAHGPIHLFTGGLAHTPDLLTWISDTFASSVSATKPSYPQYWNTILEFWLVVQRAAYRFKLYTCPESCDVATDTVETCSCSCDATMARMMTVHDAVTSSSHGVQSSGFSRWCFCAF